MSIGEDSYLDCPAEEEIFEYLGKTLPQADHDRVEKHLKGCADCRVKYEAFYGALKRLQAINERANRPVRWTRRLRKYLARKKREFLRLIQPPMPLDTTFLWVVPLDTAHYLGQKKTYSYQEGDQIVQQFLNEDLASLLESKTDEELLSFEFEDESQVPPTVALYCTVALAEEIATLSGVLAIDLICPKNVSQRSKQRD